MGVRLRVACRKLKRWTFLRKTQDESEKNHEGVLVMNISLEHLVFGTVDGSRLCQVLLGLIKINGHCRYINSQR